MPYSVETKNSSFVVEIIGILIKYIIEYFIIYGLCVFGESDLLKIDTLYEYTCTFFIAKT